MSSSSTLPSKRGGWLGTLILVIFLLGGLGAGIAAVTIHTRNWARQQEAKISLEAIDCPVPPGLGHDDFIVEVQYLSGLPEQVDLHDEALGRTLADSFAKHPWVERVERVRVSPERKVHVELTFRVPVLAVPHAGRLRAVDRLGVLLPAQAKTASLPVYRGVAATPGEAGKPWPDDGVLAAARAAASAP
ncbi:MAG: hypothetical protein AB7K24_02165 [Gemmataceae bacterium]